MEKKYPNSIQLFRYFNGTRLGLTSRQYNASIESSSHNKAPNNDVEITAWYKREPGSSVNGVSTAQIPLMMDRAV